MNKSSNKKIIKPSLKAFPISWFWILWFSYFSYSAGQPVTGLIVFFMFTLPILSVLLLSTYGRIYYLTDSTISKLNRITGKRECVNFASIRRTQIKPIAFGYGHVILTLAGGYKLKIKNIKLPHKA